MKILIINVCLRPNSLQKLVPIGLAYIMTALKNADIDFDLLDIDVERLTLQEVETFIQRKDYEIFCMGCIVTGYKFIKELAGLIRKIHPHATIIVGNSVATSIVDILLSRTEVDIAVIGEGDETIVDLIKTIAISGNLAAVSGICFRKEDEIFRNSSRPVMKDLSSLPFVNFSLFDIERYLETSQYTVPDPLPFPRPNARMLPINTARGCIASCTFCYHVFKGQRYRPRKPHHIVAEMQKMIAEYQLNYIMFWDDLSFFSKKQVIEFCKSILENNLNLCWDATCRGNLFTDETDLDIMYLMKKAGCTMVGYALESADETILRDMNKRVTIEQFTRQTKLFRKAGIPTVTSIVLGFPQETPETIQKTFDFLIENQIYPSCGYLLPQPGSKMYNYAVQHGHINDEEEYLLSMGDRQDLRINMTQMSDQEFEDHVVEGLSRCKTALGLEIDDSKLIKTGYYRKPKS